MYYLILHGRRLVHPQKWPHISAFSNSFSSVSATTTDLSGQKDEIFSVSYLVDSLGLTPKLAQSISSKDKGHLNLLRTHGFTDSQISTIITGYPQLLSEKSLAPKLQFLLSRGASTSEFTEIVSKVPKILEIKYGKDIIVYYDFIKDIIEANKSSKLCHSSWAQGSRQENRFRNLLALRELGMPQKLLFTLLISPSGGPFHGKDKFEETLKKVVEMGFDPTTRTFVVALRVFYHMSHKTIEDKVNVYKSLGFTVEDVWAIFKRWPLSLQFSEQAISNSFETFIGLGFSRDETLMLIKRFPACVGYSAQSVKKKTEFVVKEMSWSLKALVTYPFVLGYSMEKRIVARCNVIKALMSKRLICDEPPPLSNVLVCTDQLFLERYVMKHDDKQLVSELMAIFNAGRGS